MGSAGARTPDCGLILALHFRHRSAARSVERGQVLRGVQARTQDANGGTTPRRIVLWYTPDAAAGAAAALRLITLLGESEGDGVVLYSRDGRSRGSLGRFDELDSADLIVATLTVAS